MSRTYTFSLSRWHKVAERLTKAYSELAVSLKEAFSKTEVLGFAGDEQIQRLRATVGELENQFAQSSELEQCIVLIRQALAKANAEAGITEDLAHYDWQMRRLRLIQALLDGQHLNMMSITDLAASEARGVEDEDGYGRRRVSPIPLRLMTREFETKLRAELESLQAEAYALSDAIADKNRTQIEVTLPARAAQLAGLA